MEAMECKNYKIYDVGFQNLIVHIHIAIKRIQENHYVPMENVKLDNYVDELELEIANIYADRISKRFYVDFPKSEIEYIAIHLSGKKIIDLCKEENGNLVIDQEINDIVNEMLEVVYDGFKIDFKNDLELIMLLGQHLVPLRVRINFDMKMKNPLLKDIKERYSLAYAMAAQSSTVINQRYDKELDDDEIGYIALILALALERQSTSIAKKNILLVCSSGKGSAQLLAYKLKDIFSEYINNVEISDLISIKIMTSKTLIMCLLRCQFHFRNPLMTAALATNVAIMNKGLTPTQPITAGFWNVFITVGGAGITLSLIFATLLLSKRDDQKAVAKLAMAPGLCGISEPVVFGYPLVLNPIFAVPFILNSGIATAIALGAIKIGFIIPSAIDVPFGIPILLNAFIGFGLKGVIVQIVILAVCTLTWAPFVLISNKQVS